MSNSLIEIRQAEQYLAGKMKKEESAVFEARLLTDPLLKMNVYFLGKTFSLLGLYNRKKVRERAEAAHQRLFTDPDKQDFRDQIFQLFNR